MTYDTRVYDTWAPLSLLEQVTGASLDWATVYGLRVLRVAERERKR